MSDLTELGLVDTHCHIHDDDFPLDRDVALKAARAEGISDIICVGTDAKYSKQAVEFAQNHPEVWASVGLHPHDARQTSDMPIIADLAKEESVVAIGECGLDYYYDNSPRAIQQQVLREHFEIAQAHDLPMIFHIRGKDSDSADAYKDFWKIYDEFRPRGVIHSFSAHQRQLDEILSRGLYVGVNGIATFMKPGQQLDAIKNIPLNNLLLETDAPLLTPVPFRGKINEPKYISTIQAFLADARGQTMRDIGQHTSVNAKNLFGMDHSRKRERPNIQEN